MANREACELYIEQEIDLALNDGKKPYTIGKEIAALVERLFETKMNPEAIQSRARRQKKKNGSNDPKKSETRNSERVYDSGRGGKREGAGKKKSQKAVWEKVEKDLKTLTEFMLANCKTPAAVPTKTKIRVSNYIETINNFKKEI